MLITSHSSKLVGVCTGLFAVTVEIFAGPVGVKRMAKYGFEELRKAASKSQSLCRDMNSHVVELLLSFNVSRFK